MPDPSFGAVKSAYAIRDVEVADLEAYLGYIRKRIPLLAQADAHYFIRGSAHQVLDGGWEPHRLVVLELPDMESLLAFHESADYLPLQAERDAGCRFSLIAVEGVRT